MMCQNLTRCNGEIQQLICRDEKNHEDRTRKSFDVFQIKDLISLFTQISGTVDQLES